MAGIIAYMSGKIRGQRCATSGQSRAGALPISSVARPAAQDEQGTVASPKDDLDSSTQQFPESPSTLLPEPPGGYDRQFLAQHGIVAYHYFLGALEFDYQRAGLLAANHDQRIIIDFLRRFSPDLRSRQVTLEELVADMAEKQQTEIDSEAVRNQLSKLVAAGVIGQEDDRYYLSAEIEIDVDSDQLSFTAGNNQKQQLLQQLGSLDRYYRFRGALLHSYQRAGAGARNPQQQALVERLYQLLIRADQERNVCSDINYQISLADLVYDQHLTAQEELELRLELEELDDRGLIFTHTEHLRGPHYSLLPAEALPAPEQHPDSDGLVGIDSLTRGQRGFVINYSPEEYWRAQGALHQASQRAKKIAADADQPSAELITQLVDQAAAIGASEQYIWPPTDGDVKVSLQALQQRLEQKGLACSAEQLATAGKELQRRGVLAYTSSLGQGEPGLQFNDRPYSYRQYATADLLPGDQRQRERLLAEQGPEELFFRCGQVWEAALTLEKYFVADRSLQPFRDLLTTDALSSQRPGHTLDQFQAACPETDTKIIAGYLQLLSENKIIEPSADNPEAWRLALH